MFTCFLGNTAYAITLDQIMAKGYIDIAVINEQPVAYLDNGEIKGTSIDVLNDVIPQLGIKEIKWHMVGFDSLLAGLVMGKYDMGATDFSIKENSCTTYISSNPNTKFSIVAVSRIDDDRTHTLDTFLAGTGKGISMVGTSTGTFLEKNMTNKDNLVLVDSDETYLLMVLSKKVDLAFVPSYRVKDFISQSDKVKVVEGFFSDAEFKKPDVFGAFTFSAGSESFRDDFNTVFDLYKQSSKWVDAIEPLGLNASDIESVRNTTQEEICSKYK